MNVKITAFLVLCALYSALALTLRYSRGVLNERYSPSMAVAAAEMVKIMVSLFMIHSEGSASSEKLRLVIRSSSQMCLPAGVYFLQNVLGYFIAEYIEAFTAQVVAQFKLPATAVFGMLLLGKSYTQTQWRMLVLVGLGVILVSQSAMDDRGQTAKNAWIGIAGEIFSCATSGFAGVFLERLYKNRDSPAVPMSIWERNIQLGMYSLMFACVSAGLFDREVIEEKGVLGGFSLCVWFSVSIAASMGLMVAVVLKHLDAMMKTMASAVSVAVSTGLSYVFFGSNVSSDFLIGASVVVVSLFQYNAEDSAPKIESSSSGNSGSSAGGSVGRRGGGGKSSPPARKLEGEEVDEEAQMLGAVCDDSDALS